MDARPVEKLTEELLEARQAEDVEVKSREMARAEVCVGQVRAHNDQIITVGDRVTKEVTALYVIVIRGDVEATRKHRWWELRLVIERDGAIHDHRALAMAQNADDLYDWAPTVAASFAAALLSTGGDLDLPHLYEAYGALPLPKRVGRLDPSLPQTIIEMFMSLHGSQPNDTEVATDGEN